MLQIAHPGADECNTGLREAWALTHLYAIRQNHPKVWKRRWQRGGSARTYPKGRNTFGGFGMPDLPTGNFGGSARITL